MNRNFFNSQTKSISSASLILAISYLASAVLGLLRDRLLAGTFGAGNELDIYYTAFTVPDFIALILIFGAISAAVIPIFSSYLIKSKEDAWKYVSAIFNVFLGFLIIVCLILIIFTPAIISITAPGFSGHKKDLAVMLMRIMFLSPIILGASNLISGILQVFNRFLVTALAPLLYNLGIIIGILFFVPKFGLPGLAWGVVFGGILHLLIQLPVFFHSGFKYLPDFNFRDPGVVKTIKLMVPRSLGLGAGQLNTIATTAIASTLAVGSIKIFNLSNNLYCVPVGLVGLSFASAVFPALSRSHANEEKEKFLEVFSMILNRIIFFILPLSGILFILRAQAVRLLYGTQLAGSGYFGWWETRLTASSLGVMSLSLFAACLIPFLARAFFALHNTKTPLKAALSSIVLNIGLSFLFVWLLKTPSFFQNWTVSFLKLKNLTDVSVLGLSLALSISTVFQFIFLLAGLKVKLKHLNLKRYKTSFSIMIFASLLASLATYLGLKFVGAFVPTYKVIGLLVQTVTAGILGIAVYLFLCFFMGMKEPKLIWRYLCKIKSVISL